MGKPPDPLSLVAEAVQGGTARSTLGRWLTKNHDAFAALVDPGANWSKVTEALVEAGLAPKGAKPSATKRAWERVKVRVAVARAKRAAAEKPLGQARPSPTPQIVAPDPAEPPPAKYKFVPSTPRPPLLPPKDDQTK